MRKIMRGLRSTVRHSGTERLHMKGSRFAAKVLKKSAKRALNKKAPTVLRKTPALFCRLPPKGRSDNIKHVTKTYAYKTVTVSYRYVFDFFIHSDIKRNCKIMHNHFEHCTAKCSNCSTQQLSGILVLPRFASPFGNTL